MKKKILIIISSIILILAIIVLIRFNIYMELDKKYDEMNAKSNYYYYSETETIAMTYWKKDNIHKENMKNIKGEGNLTFWKNGNTNEYYMFNETKNKTYNKYIGNNGMMVENLPSTGYYESSENRIGINLMFAINPFCIISSGKYEDKDCYILGYLEEGSSKEWIEKKTGLPLYIEFANGTQRKIQYSFDTVTDEDVKMPNIEEYTLITSNNLLNGDQL